MVRSIISSALDYNSSNRWLQKLSALDFSYLSRDLVMISHNNFDYPMVSLDCNYVTYYHHVADATVADHYDVCSVTIHDILNVYSLHLSSSCYNFTGHDIRSNSVVLNIVI